MPRLYYYSLLTISLLTFYGAVIYRIYKLNYAAVFLTLALVIITLILLKKAKNSKEEQKEQSESPKINFTPLSILPFTFYVLLFTFNIFVLLKSATTTSIISPWQVIPWYFFLTYTLLTALLIAIILKTSLSKISYFILLTSYFLLSISIALIIYTFGYGFDPFIHQATEKLIAATGAVDPKPFYYLGQYALIVILHKLTFIPILWLDKLLVPFLTVIFLPPTLFQAVKSLGARTKTALLSTLFILIFPFSTFIITTPQNLANLFLLLIILLNIANPTFYVLRFTTILALATITVHPISGIPAILFVIILYTYRYIRNKKFFIFYILFFILATALALPTALYLNNKINPIITATATATASGTTSIWHLPTFFFSGTENFLLNFVYLYGFNISIIIILFIITGIIIYAKIQKINNVLRFTFYERWSPYLLMSSSLFISYFLTKFIAFPYLISYEQSTFPNRILTIAVYFTLPFILLALYHFINTIFRQTTLIKYSLLSFLALLVTASLYISYPRFDNYHNSRSYSTSASDIKAVQWINDDSDNTDYIVLANQQVSAAALREFGFKKYYQTEDGQIFYYPIPTGEQLYQYYLDMVYEQANKKTALEAAELVGVNTTYFVLNKYWWAFDKILAEAKLSAQGGSASGGDADNVVSIDDGEVYIFKYSK